MWFNENDAYPAQWLRNLWPEATVDERSIEKLAPSDVPAGRCHFFAGIGGWEYALELAGWPRDREVWTGSCPCQPFSTAGRRPGFGHRGDLWPAWLRLIRQSRPPVVFGEQAARRVDWIDRALVDLEASGYAVGAVSVPALAVGANHYRQRWWFVAYSGGGRRGGTEAALRAGRTTAELRAWWESEPGIPRLDDGVSRQVEQVRAYGNAIVPQVAAIFVRAFMETED